MSFFFTKSKEKIFKNIDKKKQMFKSVVVNAPAKIIISGDHSVIYNTKAVVGAINIFLQIKIEKLFTPKIVVIDNGIKKQILIKDFSVEYRNNDVILEIIRMFFDITKMPISGLKIQIKNNIPIGYGLGSSSALVAGIVFGLNELFNGKQKSTELAKIATSIENIFHGKSSGVDIQAIIKGGIIYTDRGKVTKISHQIDEIWIIDTGKPSFSTKNVVMSISDNFPSSSKVWNEIGFITKDIAEIMQSRAQLWQKIAHNEILLEKIGVVLPKVKTFLNDLKEQSIYGKVCGAGTIARKEKYGGNGVIGIFQILTPEQKKYLFKICRNNNFKVRKVSISNAGLSITGYKGLFSSLR